MDDHTNEPDQPEPTPPPAAEAPETAEPPAAETPKPKAPRRPRRKRPNGRWSNPASPLQAARFELRLNGLDVIKTIRRICPGHASEPCKIDVAKLSDYETGNRRMGLTHVEAFARFYNRSPEALGLIKWRDDPTGQGASADDADTAAGRGGGPARPQLVLVWVFDRLDRESAATAARVLHLLSQPTTPPTSEDSSDNNPDDPAETTD